MADARTNITVYGKEKVISIKKPGGSTYILFGCLTNYDVDEAGMGIEEIACRSGTKKSPDGDSVLPILNVESLEQIYAVGDQPTNISASEIRTWMRAGTILDIKYGGVKVGDPVTTAKAYFNGYSEKNPQKGTVAVSFKANITEAVTETIIS